MLRASLRWTWRLLVIFRRLISFLLRGSTIILICLMLLFNVATLSVGTLNSAVSSFIAAAFGVTTVSRWTYAKLTQAETKASKLDADLKKTNSDLNIERRKTDILAKKYGKVEVEARKLRVHGPDVKFRGKSRPMREVVEEVSGAVSRRTARVAATNVGSMAGEGIPFWGIAVIVGATTLEMTAACDTMKDMRALEVALVPDQADDAVVREVCGMRVPTAAELWATIKASPVAAWDTSKQFFNDLPSPDFSATWQWFVAHLTWE